MMAILLKDIEIFSGINLELKLIKLLQTPHPLGISNIFTMRVAFLDYQIFVLLCIFGVLSSFAIILTRKRGLVALL